MCLIFDVLMLCVSVLNVLCVDVCELLYMIVMFGSVVFCFGLMMWMMFWCMLFILNWVMLNVL